MTVMCVLKTCFSSYGKFYNFFTVRISYVWKSFVRCPFVFVNWIIYLNTAYIKK